MAALLVSICRPGNPLLAVSGKDCLEKPRHGIYVVAHRGAHIGIPENSLPAYEKAISLGCDFVEIDVRTTRDGQFVSIHSSTTGEYTQGASVAVRDLSFAELRSIDLGAGFGPEYRGTRIPSLREILILCKGRTGIYLDLKDADVKALSDTISNYGMTQDIIWYIPSANKAAINELRLCCPSCVLMPDPGPADNIEKVDEELKPCVLATDISQLDRQFIVAAHTRGAVVICDEKSGSLREWKRMIGWDTDGIQTDDPERLIRLLETGKFKKSK